MRVLLSVPWYFPTSTGGTEVYVRGLASALASQGVEVAVATPSCDGATTEDVVDGARVFRYAAPEQTAVDLRCNPPAPAAFAACVSAFNPDVVDQHAFTAGIGLAHLTAARAFGSATVATIHLPGFLCARGTFVRFGTAPCSGRLAMEPCTACRLQAQGVPPLVGRVLGWVPASAGKSLSILPAHLRRALSASAHDFSRRRWIAAIAAQVDRMAVPSVWLLDALVANGIAEHQLALCRQGVDPRHVPTVRTAPAGPAVRAGFIGRHDPQKGLSLAVDAVLGLPADVPIELHVWGIARSVAERSYRDAVRQKAAHDRRVMFHEEGVAPAEMYGLLDVLIVPSLTFETGPLVVLEAQAAGLPVIGFDSGGIAERVRDGVDGLLVPRGDVTALRRAVRRLSNRSELDRLLPNKAPRSVTDVATDAIGIYEDAVRRRAMAGA